MCNLHTQISGGAKIALKFYFFIRVHEFFPGMVPAEKISLGKSRREL